MSLWLYCLSLFELPKIELYYLYNWLMLLVFLLFIHNIHFIYFSMIDLYPNLKITWFSLWFFYDYLSQYDWLILLSYHSFILSIYSICFIMIDLYYWCNQLLTYTIFVLFYLSNLTLFHLFNKMQMTIYSIKWQ